MNTFKRGSMGVLAALALCANTVVLAARDEARYSSKSKMISGVIERDIDGDTVWVQPSRASKSKSAKETRMKIRMLSIDAPEFHFPANGGVYAQGTFGKSATEQLTKLVPVGTEVKVEDKGKDKYSRTLATIFVEGRDVNLKMVEVGWAIPYIICEGPGCNEDFFQKSNTEAYLQACEKARSKKLGIFNSRHKLSEMPFEFRLRLSKRDPDKYVGDFETRELFEPGDYREVDLCKRIFFVDEEDAERAGFRPSH